MPEIEKLGTCPATHGALSGICRMIAVLVGHNEPGEVARIVGLIATAKGDQSIFHDDPAFGQAYESVFGAVLETVDAYRQFAEDAPDSA